MEEEDEFFDNDEQEKVDIYRAIPKRYGEEDEPQLYEVRNKGFKFDPHLLEKVKRLEEDIKSHEDSDEHTRDAEENEENDTNDRNDPFKFTHFTSFRKFKLIEEDYKLLTVEDPEVVTDIKNENFFVP